MVERYRLPRAIDNHPAEVRPGRLRQHRLQQSLLGDGRLAYAGQQSFPGALAASGAGQLRRLAVIQMMTEQHVADVVRMIQQIGCDQRRCQGKIDDVPMIANALTKESQLVGKKA